MIILAMDLMGINTTRFMNMNVWYTATCNKSLFQLSNVRKQKKRRWGEVTAAPTPEEWVLLSAWLGWSKYTTVVCYFHLKVVIIDVMRLIIKVWREPMIYLCGKNSFYFRWILFYTIKLRVKKSVVEKEKKKKKKLSRKQRQTEMEQVWNYQ